MVSSASPSFQTDTSHVAPPKRPYCVKTKVFLMYSVRSSIYCAVQYILSISVYEPVPKGGTQKWDICSKNQTPELFITG